MQDMPDNGTPSTIIAFDYGLRRIGVAVGQSITNSASPAGIAANGEAGPDFERIRTLVDEWRPDRLVVGMPTHTDGSPSELEPAILEFVRQLGRFDLPVDTEDERYSSLEAENALKQARQAGTRGRLDKADIDAAAAVVIAERYLQRNVGARHAGDEDSA